MKRQRDVPPLSPTNSNSTSVATACSPFYTASGGAASLPVKRRKLRLSPKQQASWIRLQDELAAEREKKVRLDWYLKELLVEMESLIAQERDERSSQGQGTGAAEWAEGARYDVKLRTYKQYCKFDSDVAAAPALDATSLLTCGLGIKPEPSYYDDSTNAQGVEEDSVGGFEDSLALSVDDLTATVALRRAQGHTRDLHASTHVLPTHFIAHQPLVKHEAAAPENDKPATDAGAGALESGEALDALFESNEGLDVSHFLNFHDCHDSFSSGSVHGDDSQGEEDDEGASSGYTGSPSIDFGVVAGGSATTTSGMGCESWDAIDLLPKFAKAQESSMDRVMGSCFDSDGKRTTTTATRDNETTMVKQEAATGSSSGDNDDVSSYWAYWSIDDIVSDPILSLPTLGF